MRTQQRSLTPITVRNAGKDSAEVLVYGTIGGWDLFDPEPLTGKKFALDLKALGAVANIDVRIDSDGGSVVDGLLMYNVLKDHAATIRVQVDGHAWSIAAVLAMAGDEINMPENATMMIHDAQGAGFGYAPDLRKLADVVDRMTGQIAGIFAARTGMKLDEISGLMSAETWMTGAEAKANGFATALVANKQITNCVHNLSRFRNVPEAVSAMARATPGRSRHDLLRRRLNLQAKF